MDYCQRLLPFVCCTIREVRCCMEELKTRSPRVPNCHRKVTAVCLWNYMIGVEETKTRQAIE